MIKAGDFVMVNNKKFKVMKVKVGYKEDCFETDIGEKYFLNNRFKSWSKVKDALKTSKV